MSINSVPLNSDWRNPSQGATTAPNRELTPLERLRNKAATWAKVRQDDAEAAVRADAYQITDYDPERNRFVIVRRANAKQPYTVCLNEGTCTCPDADRMERFNEELRAAGEPANQRCKHSRMLVCLSEDFDALWRAMNPTPPIVAELSEPVASGRVSCGVSAKARKAEWS